MKLVIIEWYINSYPGDSGLKGDTGDTGAQGEPGSTLDAYINIQGDKGIKGFPGEKGEIYYYL